MMITLIICGFIVAAGAYGMIWAFWYANPETTKGVEQTLNTKLSPFKKFSLDYWLTIGWLFCLTMTIVLGIDMMSGK